MNQLNFIFKITPHSKDRPRFSFANGRPHVHTSTKTRNYESAIALMAKQQMSGKQKLFGLIEAVAIFTLKSPKKTKLATPRKDLDNMLKSAFDALNRIAFIDDTQIYKITAEKSWGDQDLIEITLIEKGVITDGNKEKS